MKVIIDIDYKSWSKLNINLELRYCIGDLYNCEVVPMWTPDDESDNKI